MANPKSAADIAAEMVALMKAADPELDTSIGSVARKILDVVAEQIAPAYAVSYLQDWMYSIDAKSGSALDDYCAQFGIKRIPAKRATGLIEFTRGKAATANIPIPVGSIVVTGTTPRVAFSTYTSAWLPKGQTSVFVPIQAMQAGMAGNLPVGSLTTRASAVSGVNVAVNQAAPTTGGQDAESDSSLRERFRRTVFRSMAGVEDMFLALALEDPTPDDDSDAQATHAVVIGPTTRWRDQVQPTGGVAESTMPAGTAKYIWAGSSVVGTDIDAGSILTEGVHYTFEGDAASVTTITSIDDNLQDDTLYDFDFEYTSSASRNDPDGHITNRVDIWVSGVAPQHATEVLYWQPQVFDADDTSDYYHLLYERKVTDGPPAVPVVGNSFLPLAWGPIVTFPSTLTIDGDTYEEGTDYWVVHRNDAFGWAPKSLFGLEFDDSVTIPDNSQILLTGTSSYYYNRIPHDVQARIEKWKMATTDVWVHAAVPVRLVVHLAIMYSRGYVRGAVEAAIDNALSNWFNSMDFRQVVQVSDIISVVHGVSGVDNVRLTHSGEPAIPTDSDSWGINKVAEDGTFIAGVRNGTRATDLILGDHQVAVLHDIRYVVRGQNTFGQA